jgi:hypothetical protein
VVIVLVLTEHFCILLGAENFPPRSESVWPKTPKSV